MPRYRGLKAAELKLIEEGRIADLPTLKEMQICIDRALKDLYDNHAKISHMWWAVDLEESCVHGFLSKCLEDECVCAFILTL